MPSHRRTTPAFRRSPGIVSAAGSRFSVKTRDLPSTAPVDLKAARFSSSWMYRRGLSEAPPFTWCCLPDLRGRNGCGSGRLISAAAVSMAPSLSAFSRRSLSASQKRTSALSFGEDVLFIRFCAEPTQPAFCPFCYVRPAQSVFRGCLPSGRCSPPSDSGIPLTPSF